MHFQTKQDLICFLNWGGIANFFALFLHILECIERLSYVFYWKTLSLCVCWSLYRLTSSCLPPSSKMQMKYLVSTVCLSIFMPSVFDPMTASLAEIYESYWDPCCRQYSDIKAGRAKEIREVTPNPHNFQLPLPDVQEHRFSVRGNKLGQMTSTCKCRDLHNCFNYQNVGMPWNHLYSDIRGCVLSFQAPLQFAEDGTV